MEEYFLLNFVNEQHFVVLNYVDVAHKDKNQMLMEGVLEPVESLSQNGQEKLLLLLANA